MFPSIDVSRLEARYTEDIEDQREILLARRYHEGEQDVYLNERAVEFLGLHDENKFRLNVCRVVVDAVLDELDVLGFDAGEEGEKRPLAAWAAHVWAINRMDAMQRDVHKSALRDRKSFVIVDWSEEKQTPTFTWHNRFTSLAAARHGKDGGDEAGCWMLYPNDDYTQPPFAAVQQWVEEVPGYLMPTFRTRRTVYYPDRIERFVYERGWSPFREHDQTWPQPWVDKAGKPLGIPVIHFKNAGMRPEAWDAIPLQDAINKTFVDILAAADMTGFGFFVAFGFYPTTDGQPVKADRSNVAAIAPGQLLGSTRPDASFQKIEGSSPLPLVETLTQIIQYAAHVTKTPASRFSASAQVASGESQKEQNKPLTSKVKARQTLFGNSWEDCMSMARKLANLWSNAGLDEKAQFSTIWQRGYGMDELQVKQALGVPQEQLWAEMGYNQAQISAMKQMDDYRMKVEALQASLDASKKLTPGKLPSDANTSK